jgi:hypothetical protein
MHLRQTLIRRPGVLVPAIFGLAFFSGIAATLLKGFGPGLGFRCVGLFSLVAFISITPAGTVPINQAAHYSGPALGRKKEGMGLSILFRR